MRAWIIVSVLKRSREKNHHLGYKRRVVKKKLVVKKGATKNRVKWCKERKDWTVDEHWHKWIFSDESQVVIGKNINVFIWRKDDEKFQPRFGVPSSQS